jgi:putative toxin-antitoxin system antitoxin component (TIGR02293 family)
MDNSKGKQSARGLADLSRGLGPAAADKGGRTRPAGREAPWSTFGTGEGKNALLLIELIREGVDYQLFERFSVEAPFSLAEWAAYLHLSERTIQRYKKEQSAFESSPSERILEIILLFNQGEKVFGQKEKFNTWLTTRSIALGNVKPKELLDSSFGINLLKDELIKIEHGVLA